MSQSTANQINTESNPSSSMSETNQAALGPLWKEYLTLTKPKVVLLMLLTVLVGMLLATPGFPDPITLLLALTGIGLCAGGSAAVNHVADQHRDALMSRTDRRPLPKGRISSFEALTFAAVITLIGVVCLLFVNQLTLWLTLASSIGYGLIYTLYLKHATPQNITIGGLAGAMPPLLGWTAVTGEMHANGWLLVLIIFAWTPPHFWALALYKKDEYAKTGVPMLPVTHGSWFTRVHILLYTLILICSTLLPYVIGMTGLLYLIAVTYLNCRFLYKAVRLLQDETHELAMDTFKYSIMYLMWLFLALLLDHYLM